LSKCSARKLRSVQRWKVVPLRFLSLIARGYNTWTTNIKEMNVHLTKSKME
jgi:hypothetical protein